MISEYKQFVLYAILGTAIISPAVNAQTIKINTINQQFIQMESPIEDMLEEIGNKNDKKLRKYYKEIRNRMSELNQINLKRNKSDSLSREIALQNSWFNLVSIEINEMDDISALASIINQFSGQLIITTEFKYQYEKNVAWMDYLGRELLILNKYPSGNIKNKTLIEIRKADLKATWDKVKAIILSKRNNVALIQKVDTVIHKIMNETDADKLIALSEKELEQVDSVEEYFHIK